MTIDAEKAAIDDRKVIGTASSGVAGDPLALSAVAHLASHDLMAVFSLDENLTVRSAFNAGWIAVEPGIEASRALPFLARMEGLLHGLEIGGRHLTLHNIGLDPLASDPVKVTAQVFRVPDGYLVLLQRVAALTQLEHEVIRQVRARRVAEAELRAAESALAASAERLQRTNVELSRVNRELDAFAHVISHDLKAPLRAMRVTLEAALPEDESEGAGDAEPRVSLLRQDHRRLQRQVALMSEMITGLLSYARGTSDLELVEEVDTHRLISRIVDGLEVAIGQDGDAGITFRIAGDWPMIETVPDALDVVLRNLVSNAVKHHDRATGLVRISAQRVGDETRFSVADDGPGIPRAAQSMVFKPFRSAKGVSPDGSGLGLSMVKKLCDRFNAKVDIESPLHAGRGTAFHVDWPHRVERKDQ
ncbi:MAG: hypothetical protein GC150_16035 [Rhizobiales bacterium]|nr:hypothetical protein [Hyphomicrobiales bacterium]